MTTFEKTCALLGALVLATQATAQEGAPDLSPAPGMSQFRVLLGNWEGSGTVWMEAGGEPQAWTAVGTVTEILGGHAVQEDMRIDLGPELPPLEFRSLYGWDRAADRPVSFSLSNMGSGGEVTIRWVDEHTLIGVAQHVEQGEPLAERWIARFTKEGYAFQLDQAKGSQPYFKHVDGRFRRSDERFDAQAQEASVRFAPPGTEAAPMAEMKPLAGLVGSYELAGKVRTMPDAPMMDITGREDVEWMFGGTVLASHGQGDPIEGFAWEGVGYQWWDPERACLAYLHADNMGHVATSEGRWLDEQRLIYTSASVYQGAPLVERTIVALDEKGRIKSVSSDGIHGGHAPARGFEATYTPKAGGAAPAALVFKAGSCCDRAQKAGKTCTHACCVAAAKEGKVCADCN